MIDETDAIILDLLQENARISQADVARAVGLAPSAVLERIRKLESRDEDLDVRMAAASTLGNIAKPDDAQVVEALTQALNETDPQKAELVWNAAGALAEQVHQNCDDAHDRGYP